MLLRILEDALLEREPGRGAFLGNARGKCRCSLQIALDPPARRLHVSSGNVPRSFWFEPVSPCAACARRRFSARKVVQNPSFAPLVLVHFCERLPDTSARGTQNGNQSGTFIANRRS